MLADSPLFPDLGELAFLAINTGVPIDRREVVHRVAQHVRTSTTHFAADVAHAIVAPLRMWDEPWPPAEIALRRSQATAALLMAADETPVDSAWLDVSVREEAAQRWIRWSARFEELAAKGEADFEVYRTRLRCVEGR